MDNDILNVWAPYLGLTPEPTPFRALPYDPGVNPIQQEEVPQPKAEEKPESKPVEEVKTKVQEKKEVKKEPEIDLDKLKLELKKEVKKEFKEELAQKREEAQLQSKAEELALKEKLLKAQERELLDARKPSVEELIPKENYQASPLFYELATFFGIRPDEYEGAKDRLSVIADWGILKSKSNKPIDVMHAIRDLEERVIKPAWGESRHGNLYRHIRLSEVDNLLRK